MSVNKYAGTLALAAVAAHGVHRGLKNRKAKGKGSPKAPKRSISKTINKAKSKAQRFGKRHQGSIGKLQVAAGRAYGMNAARKLSWTGAARAGALEARGRKNIQQAKKGNMSRSQAARVAAQARWHGGGGRRKK